MQTKQWSYLTLKLEGLNKMKRAKTPTAPTLSKRQNKDTKILMNIFIELFIYGLITVLLLDIWETIF